MIRPLVRTAGAVVGASLLAALILLPFTQDPSYLISAIPLAVLIGGIGLWLRRMRINDAIVFLAQLVLLAVYLFAISLSLAGPGLGLPGLFAEGVQHMATHTTPMIANPGLTMLLVGAVGVTTLLTDLLAEGVDRPAWAVLPSVTLYLIGAVGLLRDIPWWTVVALALGYLWILLADGINSAEKWPRHLERTVRLTGRITPLAARMGTVVAVAALAATLLIGVFVPLPPSHQLNGGQLNQDTGPVQLADPMLDMRRNLSQPADTDVLSYTTTAPDGEYLRMASLSVFDSKGWQNASFHLTQGNTLPPPPGQDTPGQDVRTQVTIGDFRSEYLPLPYAPKRFEANGQWAFGTDSLVVVATGQDRTAATRNLSYDVTSVDPTPDGATLSTAMAGRPSDANLTATVPQDMPQEIVDLTLKITQAEPTPALKAAAIQAYLRSDQFTYSLEPQPGTGYDAMKRFLLQDRKGYCEQFAGSMAAMARIVGIPSRVAVGWLPGTKQGDGYAVTLHDMHAWPELYFEGVGWVRFEPTPGVAVPPAWTMTAPEQPDATPTPTPASEPTPEVTPEASASASPSPAPVAPARPVVDVLAILARIGVAIVLLALITGILSLPGLLRHRLRTRRLTPVAGSGVDSSQEAVDAAWEELRDSFVDYGHGWPSGSPRAVGKLAAAVLPEDAAVALVTLSRQVERSRYAQGAVHSGDLAAMVGTIRDGLRTDTSWDARLIGEWWPRSWWHALGQSLAWSALRRRVAAMIARRRADRS
ncbi:transglutaminaseTgpA domain-containing protein [Raineyella sp. LH-20]|uniref:transglutaminase family protein n=1 Tax=Raineyella sp. LH-20 TaxID=3081204 RepID=UPI002953DBA5|nr:transglutaminaseTgpA domain-containing protein [Raineyella sp. LH-20]WOP17641.1 transglutaminaseTgpA domain-containing protein [Raineyella sp. LH-20]